MTMDESNSMDRSAGKMHLAYVADDIESFSELALIESLTHDFKVTVHCFEGSEDFFKKGSKVSVVIYSRFADMPEYMKELDKMTEGVDGIICKETARLSSFQCALLADERNVPLVVVCSEIEPLKYVDYKNVLAIQTKVEATADAFVCLDRSAEAPLLANGVSHEKIKTVHSIIDSSHFQFSREKRKKFREYINLQDDHCLIVCVADFADATSNKELLEAFANVIRRDADPRHASARLLFIGEESGSRDLKLKVAELEVSQHVLFLHQSTTAFWSDLMSACDAMVENRMSHPDRFFSCPWHVFEAQMAGAPVSVTHSSLSGVWLGKSVSRLLNTDVGQLTGSMKGFLDDSYRRKEASDSSGGLTRKNINVKSSGNLSISEVVKQAMSDSELDGGGCLNDIFEKCEKILQKGDSKRSLSILASIDSDSLSDDLISRLEFLRGKSWAGLREYEEATKSLEIAVQHNAQNYHAVRELGFVCWFSHQHEKALGYLKRALSLSSEDSEAMLGIGMVYARLSLDSDAIFWLEKSMHGLGNPNRGMYQLCQSCLQASDSEGAMAAIDRLIEQFGDHQALLMTKGQLFHKLGKSDQANELLLKALDNQKLA